MAGKIWHDLFFLGSPLLAPVLEKVLRTVGVYFFLILGLRLAGKRELAQLNPFDLVVLLLLSNTVQNAIIGEDNTLAGGVIGATALLLLNAGVVRLLYSHRRLDRLVEGGEEPLIEHGKVHEQRLKRELIRRAQLEAAARKQGFDSLEEVDKAILEPGGFLVFTRKSQPDEVLARLDRLSEEVARLREAQERALPPA